MSDYYQKYLKYKKKYLVAKNTYLNQLGSSTPPGSPNSSMSIKSFRPPQIKKKRKIVEEIDWTDLYQPGEAIMWNKGILSTVISKTKEPSALIIDPIDVDPSRSEPIPGSFPVNSSKLIKPIPGNLRRIYLYGGCLGPPHKGHLDLIAEKALELTGPNDKMIIGLEGDDMRHGFDSKNSITIINKFLELKDISDKVEVYITASRNLNFPHLEVLRLVAKKMSLSYRDLITVIVGEDYTREGKISSLNESIEFAEEENNIDIETDIMPRPEDSILSSTNLARLLKDYNEQGKDDTVFDMKLKEFLPSVFISNPVIYNEIKLLLTIKESISTLVF